MEKHVSHTSQVALGTLSAALVVLTGCAASTHLRATWSDPSAEGFSLRRAVIVQTTRTGADRRAFEARFAAAMKSRGIDCDPGDSLQREDPPDAARVRVEDFKAQRDALLLTRAVNGRIVRSHGVPCGGYPASRGQGTAARSRTERGVIETRVIDLQTRLYRTSDGVLIWSGLTRSSFPKSDAPEKQVDAIVGRLVPAMENAGIELDSATPVSDR